MTTMGQCVLCNQESKIFREATWGISHHECPSCGQFSAVDGAVAHLSDVDKRRLSACLRERTMRGLPPVVLVGGKKAPDAESDAVSAHYILRGTFPSRIQDRFDRVLANLCRLTVCPGKPVVLEEHDRLPVTFSETPETAWFMLRELQNRGLITIPDQGHGLGNRRTTLTVTGAGIERMQQLEGTEGREVSTRAFVAMWFDKSLDALFFEGIEPAITDCGFSPLRIDGKQTNGKICDEIVAEIRRSRFVVADFTGSRGGVYFEAGFAMGLGIPVIWTCKNEHEHIEALHFDTRQYAHILWDSPEDMRKKLADRIAATIPGTRRSG